MIVKIETNDHEIFKDLININNASEQIGTSIDIFENISISFNKISRQKGVETSIIFEILINYAEVVTLNIFSGLISAWLYDKLINRSAKLYINEDQVGIDKKSISKKIEQDHK